MEYVTFLVHERPQVYWDPNLQGANCEYLRGVDAGFYMHVVEAHAPFLEDDDSRHRAAASLRIAYGQGLETLFALLCAMIQAPSCVVGWMQSYRNDELRAMVAGLNGGQRPRARKAFRPATFEHLAECVFSCVDWEAEKRAWIAAGFARLWSRYASDFLADHASDEYNALKHGLRPRLGGFHLSIGLQPDRGVPAPPEAMRSMGGSEFGSRYFAAEKLGSENLHRRLDQVSVNWVPQNLINGLALLEMSIGNVIGFLRIGNGDPPGEVPFTAPLQESDFDLPWESHPGVSTFSHGTRFGIDAVEMWSKDEVERMIDDLDASS